MILYACAVFLAAFLLFQIQPLIAKIVLPWFGGTSSVWNTCMLFFQVALLLGYLYAHWLHERLERAQAGRGPRGGAAGEPRGAAGDARRVMEDPGGRQPRVAHPFAAGRHGRAAVFPALDYQPAVAGVVRAHALRRRSLPAVRTFESRIACGAAELSGAGGAEPQHAGAGAGVVGRLRLFCAARGCRGLAKQGRGSGQKRLPGYTRSPARLAITRAVGGAARYRFHPAAGDHHLPHTRRRRHPVPLDPAAERLPAELHHLLRGSSPLSPRGLFAAARGRARHSGVYAVGRPGYVQSCRERGARYGRALRLLHGVSRRTGAAQTAPAIPDGVLPDALPRRCARRGVRRAGGAKPVQRLLSNFRWGWCCARHSLRRC